VATVKVEVVLRTPSSSTIAAVRTCSSSSDPIGELLQAAHDARHHSLVDLEADQCLHGNVDGREIDDGLETEQDPLGLELAEPHLDGVAADAELGGEVGDSGPGIGRQLAEDLYVELVDGWHNENLRASRVAVSLARCNVVPVSIDGYAALIRF
jgi:hypothetical protein